MKSLIEMREAGFSQWDALKRLTGFLNDTNTNSDDPAWDALRTMEAHVLRREREDAELADSRVKPLVVVSPHLDDAVLSCGQLLAAHPGSVVVTTFAFQVRVNGGYRLTPWDRMCGMKRGHEVPQIRRGEDQSALGYLACHARHVYDDQRAPDDMRDIFYTIAEAWRSGWGHYDNCPRHILIPMGMGHPDHNLVFNRALDAKKKLPKHLRWFVYEEPVRRHEHFKEMKSRIRKYKMRPVRMRVGPLSAKRQAVACYASQLVGLRKEWGDQFDDIFAPEGFWRLP